jgi:glycosyltransferase involved in cell wall biosynthesis
MANKYLKSCGHSGLKQMAQKKKRQEKGKKSPKMIERAVSPTISLCMIVKNEERFLAQAIDSVRSIVSEIVIVDTGSTDGTLDIAKRYAAKVFHRPWDDDFSAPRNYSLEQATKDWILVLDADEAIAGEELNDLVAHTKHPHICWEFMQRHYTNDHRLSEFKSCVREYPKWEKTYAGYFESNLVRLFPNHRGIEYRGRVHELVEHKIREIPDLKIQRSKVRIQHYGHTPEVREKKDKSLLYTPLGRAKLGDNPEHWQGYFEMGVEHNNNGRHWESVTAFLQSINLNPSYVPTWVNLGYVYCELGRYKQAEVALMGGLDLDPQNDEAYCNLGVTYMRWGKSQQAENCFRKALQLNGRYVNAYCNLGKLLAMANRASEAIVIYRRALEVMPNCAVAHADLGAIYLSSRLFTEAEAALKEAARLDSSISHVFFHLGQLYKASSRIEAALEAFERYCAVEGDRLKRAPSPQGEQFLAQVRSEMERLRKSV